MISDKKLMRISLLASVTGIILLFAVVQFVEPQKVGIGRINDDMLGQNVEVSGTVESFSANDGNVFFTLNDGNRIKIVVFERAARNIPGVYDLKNGQGATVSGKISLYKSELEIVAESVKSL